MADHQRRADVRRGRGGDRLPGVPDEQRDRSFDNVIVNARLAVDELHGGPDWSGAHIWVRYQSEYELYAVSVDREDGTIIVKKKCAGGDSNGGTYYDLTDYQGGAAVPFGEWQNVTVALRTSRTARCRSPPAATATRCRRPITVSAVERFTTAVSECVATMPRSGWIGSWCSPVSQ